MKNHRTLNLLSVGIILLINAYLFFSKLFHSIYLSIFVNSIFISTIKDSFFPFLVLLVLLFYLVFLFKFKEKNPKVTRVPTILNLLGLGVFSLLTLLGFIEFLTNTDLKAASLGFTIISGLGLYIAIALMTIGMCILFISYARKKK